MGWPRRVETVVERHEGGLVLRVLRRMVAINGYDRALALSAQAFVGLIPMLVIISALAPEPLLAAQRTALIAGLGLSGDAEATVSELVHRPPGVETITIASGVLLVLSVLGFTRALQRAYLSAWGLPSIGIRGLLHGLLASVALIGGFGGLALLGPVLGVIRGHVVVQLVAGAVAATLLWWPVQRLLLGGRARWRVLLPGAVLTGVGGIAVLGVSALVLPLAISHEAAKYGLIGAAIAVVSWLLVLGLLLVLSAVVGAELARTPAEQDDPSPAATNAADQVVSDG